MTAERWETLTKREQLLNLMAELDRAGEWQLKDEKLFHGSLERALELIDLTISDSRWAPERRMLLGFRDEAARFYAGERTEDVTVLGRAL